MSSSQEQKGKRYRDQLAIDHLKKLGRIADISFSKSSSPFQIDLLMLHTQGIPSHQEAFQMECRASRHCRGHRLPGHTHSRKQCKHIYPSFTPSAPLVWERNTIHSILAELRLIVSKKFGRCLSVHGSIPFDTSGQASPRTENQTLVVASKRSP